jgi:23S rRNA pseudouridine2604 synthase
MTMPGVGTAVQEIRTQTKERTVRMRLNKYISESGLCSRREADRLIESGRVTVDGQRAEPGMQVTEDSDVRVGRKKIGPKKEIIVLAVNKPVGIVCTEDMREKRNIIRFLNYPVRLTYAGRLDKDSEGLLIMTNDGELIQRMMRSRYGHEKEYRVTVHKPVTEEFLERMRQGVHISDKEKGLDAVTFPCRAEKIGKYTFSIVLTQGLNRQIRRMCEALGYKVTRLIRIRIMNIGLDGLMTGKTREITGQELKELYERAGV